MIKELIKAAAAKVRSLFRYRSSRTGRFVSRKEAERNSDTTTRERRK